MRTYLYEQVANDLRDKIMSGRYLPGVKLPSRRELCRIHGVSEIVVMRATWILKQEGLVTGLAGVGVFVADPLPDPVDKPPEPPT